MSDLFLNTVKRVQRTGQADLCDEESKSKFYVVNAKTGENRGSIVVDPYDLADEEYDAITEEVHDNLVRSLIEAGDEIRELRELLARAYEQLMLLGYDSGFTNEEIYKLTNDIKSIWRKQHDSKRTTRN